MRYDSIEWLESLAPYRRINEQALWAIFAHLGKPTAYLDIGAGDGWMVRTARMAGCKPAIGIEYSVVAKKFAQKWAKLLVHDLTQPLRLRERFDLVTCIEVAEHLPAEANWQFVVNLCSTSSRWIVFTAAPPGQNGNGHINCQDQEYWRGLITAHGFNYVEDKTVSLRETWKYVTEHAFWLPQNIQVFKRNV